VKTQTQPRVISPTRVSDQWATPCCIIVSSPNADHCAPRGPHGQPHHARRLRLNNTRLKASQWVRGVCIVVLESRNLHRQSASMAAGQTGERSDFISPEEGDGMTAFPRQSPSPISSRAGQIPQAGSLGRPRRLAAVPALAAPAALATLAADDGGVRLRSHNRRAILGVASAATFGGCSGGAQKQADGGAARGSRCWPRGC
jgi:hypothetical protein